MTSLPRVAVAALALAATGAASAQTPPTDLQARNWAASCANCHGTNGHALGDMKPLAGMKADTLIAHVADYKSGVQAATIMHQIAKGLTDEQVKAIAGYFAAQPAKDEE